MIRVLLADDQALVRAGFAALLDAQDGIEVVGQAADGMVAVRLVRELTPDVVLMDIRMPGLDGLPPPGGSGIAGMRERVAALGGQLHAGPRPEGGFRVTATLPLDGSA